MQNKSTVSSVRETIAGTWKVRWRQNDRSMQKTFRRKADAIKFQAQLYEGEPVAAQQQVKLSFAEFAQLWLDRHCLVNVEASTAVDYQEKLRGHILPFFGKMQLQSIDENDVIRFKEWLTIDKGFSPVTVGNLLRLTKLIFNCACRWRDDKKRYYLSSSPAANVREPKKPEADFNFWTTSEIRRFLDYTRERAPSVHDIALLTTATGLRRGEIHQLQGDCLDFENRLITVKRSFSFKSRKIQHTKAKRIRRIPMNAEVYAMLQKYRDCPPERRVFEGTDIEHFHKKLVLWSERAGVSRVGLHDLRDTFASSLVKAGKKIKVIQHLLGHVDISVTEKYMHLDPADLRGATDCLSYHC